MRTLFLFVLLATTFLSAPGSTALAGSDSQPSQAPAPKLTPANEARFEAAEARYRAWTEQEHAKDAAAFAKEKAAIEDKYKGYVRPVRKKDAKPAPAPAKSE